MDAEFQLRLELRISRMFNRYEKAVVVILVPDRSQGL